LGVQSFGNSLDNRIASLSERKMKVEDFLASGEQVLLQDGDISFTDRRFFVMYRNSVEEASYEHVSAVEFERSVPWILFMIGALVLVLGLLLRVFPGTLKPVVFDPTVELMLTLVLGIGFIGMGFALTRRTLTIHLDSGRRPYRFRIGDQRTVEVFLKTLGRTFSLVESPQTPKAASR
jgi:hypothetical protein